MSKKQFLQRTFGQKISGIYSKKFLETKSNHMDWRILILTHTDLREHRSIPNSYPEARPWKVSDMHGIRHRGSFTRPPWCLKSKDHNNYSTRKDNYWQFYGISISHLLWVNSTFIQLMNICISIRTSAKLTVCWDKPYVHYIYRQCTNLTNIMTDPCQYI